LTFLASADAGQSVSVIAIDRIDAEIAVRSQTVSALEVII
jgi:hypothetical protein